MRVTYILALGLLAGTSGVAIAQEENSETAPMAEEVMTDEMMDEEMAEEVMTEEMAEEEMADEVMDEEAPSLAEIAASDPAVSVRTNEDGEADAMVMLADVLFGFGDASLSPDAQVVLAGIAEKLDGVPSLAITGHTDAIGAESINLALGQRRAEAVRDWLIQNTALDADAITAQSLGEADPIAPNQTADGADNPEGRALNRRVEFTLPDMG